MDDDGRTRRWEKLPRLPSLDPLQALRSCIAQVKKVPGDVETRRQLRAIAAEQGLWEDLAVLLADEARAASHRPELALAFHEELVDVYEQLDQPLEVIGALESVVALAPSNADAHDRLAWRYRKAGAWAKAAAAFEQVGELSRDNRARAALRAAAQLYRENKRLDRAAEVYRIIVDRKPSDDEAWRALDDVLSELGRWREVAGVRAERASRADGVDKAALLRAQARALEQAGELAAAAEVVAKAAQHAPENVSGLVDYVEVLARSGRHREAAELLQKRIDEATATNEEAPTLDPDARSTVMFTPDDRGATEPVVRQDFGVEDIAALRLRLAKIRAAFDRAGAVRALEEVLAENGNHLGALEELVALSADDAKAHAAALVRLATALPATTRRTTLVEAARRYREAGDHRAAVRIFEEATELASDDEALRGELEEARTALVVEKARADAAAGDHTAAERRLRAALATRPLDVDANLALVGVLEAQGKQLAAAEHLQATLAGAPEDAPRARLAPIVFRYAQVTAALGDDDEAHQLLHEAHRLDRDAPLVTLALGESCFRRRVWRQAALHLGALADHPAAAQHAPAIAASLVHAGQAEVRGLRPANAMKHYQAAVRLDPACAPAWHALAELALEKGDTDEAARCLEREAAATTAPRDRVRLFAALGDMARDVLGDVARAERYWWQVVELADAPLLEKLRDVQRARGAGAELGQTCERLAAVVDDPKRQPALLEEAARAYAHANDLPRAREIADRLLAARPHDIDAVACASALALAADDFGDARAMLRRALTAWEATGDRGKGDGRRADLWRRLGDAERQLGDPQAALAAYRTAVALAPDSDSALVARRGLVELASSSGRQEQSALFVLVEAEQQPADVLTSARNLAAAEQHADARATFELARILGAPLTAEDQRYFDAHPPRPMSSDQAYASALDEADRRELVDDPSDPPLGDILEIIVEAAPLILPDARTALFDAGFDDARRLAVTSEAAAIAIYPQIAKAFGGPPTLLHVTERADTDLTLLLASPPLLVLGPAYARQRPASRGDTLLVDELRGDAALRFRLGRIVELARTRRLVAAATTADAFARFVRALYIAAGKPDPRASREVHNEADRLRGRLPVPVRQRLGDKLATIPFDALDPEAYWNGCQRAADRTGLLACGDAAVAIDLAGGPQGAPHLVQLASSKRYLALRRRLRPAMRSRSG